MKKHSFLINLFILIALTISVYGEQWDDHWIRAVEYCGEQNYEAAENEFNLTIAILEQMNDETHPHVYVDRARLFTLLNRYSEALIDLNKAISSDYLRKNDRIRCLLTRIFAGSNLGMEEQVLRDYDEFKALSSNFPKVEFTKEKVIIRNVPNSKCYKSLAKAFLIGSKICEKESDIIELNSSTMIAYRKKCNCGCDKLEGKAISSYKAFSSYKALSSNNENRQTLEDCKYWCDKCALAGMAWCAKVFKRWDCQTGCIFAVDLIKDGCYWCCNEGNFYKKCVEPFENIVKYMPQPCEPEWD